MDNNVNEKTNFRKPASWVVVWGLIWALVAYNLYFDNRLNENRYRAQYEAESQRADSLYIEKVRLEQRLRQIEKSSLRHLSTSPLGTSPNPVASNEL
ncbi:hypothetical protein GO730_15770 [Spirosoma sp. HMF3257]|uniref:Uncharacterized protein n=1 Tax=Spirosoma telluris TaxID=2183553 RepID=A0A327NJC1_9BACT|nr:hypothetical protein [Spirosoma telluris]RAI75267.1 hypothetical protein HMF3257_15720 [Spirosoma telluris]